MASRLLVGRGSRETQRFNEGLAVILERVLLRLKTAEPWSSTRPRLGAQIGLARGLRRWVINLFAECGRLFGSLAPPKTF